MSPSPVEPATLRTAGLARRLLAVAIDTLPAALVVAICFAAGIFDADIFEAPPGWFWTEWIFKFWLDSRGELVAPMLALAALSIAWTTAWEAATSSSLGGRVAGLVVVDRSAFRIGPVRAILRGLGAALNAATLGLGYLWIFASSYRRGWHDLVAGTVVVVERKSQIRRGASKTVGAS